MSDSDIAATIDEGMQAIGDNLHPLSHELVPAVHNSLTISEAIANVNSSHPRHVILALVPRSIPNIEISIRYGSL